MTTSDLILLAIDMQTKAYAPYSNFSVGAVLECDDGSIYTGCNVESASYACCICAERVALGNAISDGKRAFRRLVIAGSGEDFCYPCGVCRQNFVEFSPSLQIIAVNGNTGAYQTVSLSDLLPHSFTAKNLESS